MQRHAIHHQTEHNNTNTKPISASRINPTTAPNSKCVKRQHHQHINISTRNDKQHISLRHHTSHIKSAEQTLHRSAHIIQHSTNTPTETHKSSITHNTKQHGMTVNATGRNGTQRERGETARNEMQRVEAKRNGAQCNGTDHGETSHEHNIHI